MDSNSAKIYIKGLKLSPLKSKESLDANDDAPIQQKNKRLLVKDDPHYQVDSCTIVKQSEVEFPLQFHQLKSNTDLKNPPSYWLHGQSTLKFPTMTPKNDDFSSFLMAHQFIECIGEVDVISDAQNIKKLLKIPFNNKDHVSMVIHRVGKTLLIDSFDIYKYLCRQSDNEWKWLRNLFFSYVQSISAKQENILVRPNKSRDAVQSRNLLSKFLYYSIGTEEESLQSAKTETSAPTSVYMRSNSTKDVMPDPPPLEEHLPQATVDAFTGNIIWNFEDLQMLIGTNLPIFGGGTHPCVSLRLRDMNKPINILTGIDYWLDNLMCNVPEVVMCYHLDGIVQKYELIKTEDLPHLKDSHFSPELIRDIAHNILSFLKSKATKEGHTYWLFKEKDDDIVKLYDLTSLCFEQTDLTDEESDAKLPFTIPVALLFYRVANSLWHSDISSNHAKIRGLLQGSLMLLDPNTHCEVFCSSHYILSDLYIPNGISTESPHASDLSDDECPWDFEAKKKSEKRAKQPLTKKETKKKKKKKKSLQNSMNSMPSINISSLRLPHKLRPNSGNARRSSPLDNNLPDRCEKALHHVISALEQIEASEAKAKAACSPQKEFDVPKMAKPFEPIPMPYSPLKEPNENSDKSDKSCDSSSLQGKGLSVSVSSTRYNVPSWNTKIKVLLLQKAALIFLVKSRLQFKRKKFGSTLYYIKMVLHCWEGMMHILDDPEKVPPPCEAYSLAGDIYYLLSKSWESSADHIEEFNSMSEQHLNILNILEKIIPRQGSISQIKIPCDIEEAMSLSLNAFQGALSARSNKRDVNLIRRIASISNELGSLYMDQAGALCQQIDDGFKCATTLWDQSVQYLEKSLNLFREAEDYINIVLVHNNVGRLYRLCAFYCAPKTENRVFSNFERHYYNKAIGEYRKALNLCCGTFKENEDIQSIILWEYSTTLFNMAITLQNCQSSENSTTETQKEIIELFNNALKNCDLNTNNSKLPLFQYRAGLIYSHLAEVYYKALKNRKGDRNTMKHLADLNYVKANVYFSQFEKQNDILKNRLNHVHLMEEWDKGARADQLMESHINKLELLLNLECFSEPRENNKSSEDSKCAEGEREDQEEFKSLLVRYEKTLQSCLISLMKSLKGKPKSESIVAEAKQMYSTSLNRSNRPLEDHLLTSTTSIKKLFQPLLENLKKL